ncbi:MAG: zinc-ribbon domain-containing protein, partial [Clostridia bacterium]|nr:zinc-ribbon domain-containing protein [Clostridia bacterium]
MIDKEKSLAYCFPELAKEWHLTKNGELSPGQITYGSNKRVWWQCKKCGNEWQTSVANRVRGTGCPICAKAAQGLAKIQKHIEKNGSFADHFPELIEEWDFSQNDVVPSEVSYQSHRRVWWKCKTCDHLWATTVYHRTVRKSGCPACSNK